MRTSATCLLLAALAAVLACAAAGTPAEDDLITNLPGLGDVGYKQYAGYVTVDEEHGRNLFYWLQESQRDPANDPLVLWLNGGPGCSSVGGGLMTEMGAFFPNKEGTLDDNPWSWNRIANVVYLESPAGVGFSFSDDPADYTVGDNRTAHDSYTFLLGFLERFPMFADSPFWVTGESYGGHYVPGLSALIVEMNAKEQAAGNKGINFKGMMVGNAWTVAELDNTGAVTDWYTHNLISEEVYNGILDNCNMSNVGPLAMELSAADYAGSPDGAACDSFQNQGMAAFSAMDIYNIYIDICADAPSGGGFPIHTGATDDDPTSNSGGGARFNFDPCMGNYVPEYLNRLDVQTAIHANTSLGYKWSACSPRVNYSRFDLLSSMLPTYEYLLKSGIEILVYSGDVDAIVPTPGTRAWLKKLDLTITKAWAPWTLNGQTGGFWQQYDGLRFTTVRNAGHQVPQYQPSRAFKMFDDFLNGRDF